MSAAKKRISCQDVLMGAEGSWYRICNDLATCLLNSESPEQDFQTILEMFEPILFEKDLLDVEEENKAEWEQALSLYTDLVNGYMRVLSEKNEEKTSYYSSLWRKLQEKSLFPDSTALAAGLCIIMRSQFIPYYQLPEGLRLSNEEFHTLFEQQRDKLRFILYVMLRPLIQRTEKASILLDMLDSVKDSKQRAVLMAYVLTIAAEIDKERTTG